MLSSKPIVVDNVTYDRLSINLAVSTSYNTEGQQNMSVALRAVPTAVTSDGVLTLDSQAKTMYKGSLNELVNVDEQAYGVALIQALQNLLSSKEW